MKFRKSPDNADQSKIESLEVKVPRSDCLSVNRGRAGLKIHVAALFLVEFSPLDARR